MGSNLSSNADLSKNPLLNRLVSKEILLPGDPFWNSFLSFNFKTPLTKDAWRFFESNIEELLKRFLISNLKTGNFVSLIKVILIRYSELQNSVLTDNTLFIWQTCNALFIVRTVLKFMSERIKEEDLVKQFTDRDESDPSTLGTCCIEKFISSLVDIVVELPVKDETYRLLLEATQTLLVLLSPVLFTNAKPPTHMEAWRILMTGGPSVLATALTCMLLTRYIEQSVAPPSVLGQEGGSLVLGLASGMWNILTLGYGSGEADPTGVSNKPLADSSLLLLLVLLNHWTEPSQNNPYRHAIFHCANATDKIANMSASNVSFYIEFPFLFKTFSNTLQDDEPTLLLYLFLHRNAEFRNYVLAATDIDQIVIPILQTLYRAPESNNHLTYMSLIIILILSEDDLFNQTVHSCVLKSGQVAWYTERNIPELSLGGLLILVVIRTIQYNMLKMRDKYLHTNCLAALANMSGLFKNLHPYVAQRVVSLFETLARKHSRLVEGLKGVDSSAEGEDGFDEVSDAVQDAAVLEEVLRMVLEVINSCILQQIQNNPNLIYALLYKREMFQLYAKNPAFQDLLVNIDCVLDFMARRVEEEGERQGRTLGVGEVQQIVREGSQQFPRDRLVRSGDLKFKYVEEEEPEDFFIPYVWSLTEKYMFWNAKCIKLTV